MVGFPSKNCVLFDEFTKRVGDPAQVLGKFFM